MITRSKIEIKIANTAFTDITLTKSVSNYTQRLNIA